MECKRIEGFLSPYLDKSLAGKETALVEKHLRTCPRCPRELERLKRTVHLINSLEEAEPPQDFLSEIHRKLKAESRWRRFLNKVFFPLPVKLPLEALVAVLIAVVIVSLNRPYCLGPITEEMAKRLPESRERREKREMVIEESKFAPNKEGEKIVAAKEALEKTKPFAPGAEQTIPEREKNILLELSNLAALEETEALKSKAAHYYEDEISFSSNGRVGKKSDQKERKVKANLREEAATADNYLKQGALSANCQVQVATESIPLGLIKAQKVIYLNKGKITSPSDEDIVTQVASRETRYSQILFEMPSRNYPQVLTQLKEVGKITSIIPPKKVEKDKVLCKKEEKPALIHVQLELIQSGKE